jgi:hypothetical protein
LHYVWTTKEDEGKPLSPPHTKKKRKKKKKERAEKSHLHFLFLFFCYALLVSVAGFSSFGKSKRMRALSCGDAAEET